MKYLYIVRGHFGTGKTEFARTITDNVVSCWDYYERYGANKWNEALKPKADLYCRKTTAEFMTQGMERVAVTNSFSKNSDLDYYYDLAEQHGYKVFCMIINCHEGEEHEQYKRDAPEEVVLKQIINLKKNVMFYHGF